MELITVLAVVGAVVTAAPILAWWLGNPVLRMRIRRAENVASSLQELGLPPTGGIHPGAPPVVVYREPDDALVVIAGLPVPLTMYRRPDLPLGFAVSGAIGLVTLEAANLVVTAGAVVVGSEVRVWCRRGVDLPHAVDSVRELHAALVRPTPDAVAATIRATLASPDQVRASLTTLRGLDRALHDELAANLVAAAPDAAKVELLDALRRDYELVQLAVSAASRGRHLLAWEAALRVATAPGDPPPGVRWASALVAFEVCGRALVSGAERRWSEPHRASLVREWPQGFPSWAPGARDAAAGLLARSSLDGALLCALLDDDAPEVRALAVARLAEHGGVGVVPALRAGQASGRLPTADVDRAVAAIQTRAGGVPGALAVSEGVAGGGLSLPPVSEGGQVAEAGATFTR